MLDAVSLRVSFAIVAVTLLALFYFVAFRSTRSSYAGWWCVALGLFLAGSGAYLLDGTDQQWWANPTGNVCVVAGAAGVWAGARAVAGRRVRWPAVGATLLALLVASALDDPGTNTWSGGAVFLALMTLYIGLAAFELQQAGRAAAFASGTPEYAYDAQRLSAVDDSGGTDYEYTYDGVDNIRSEKAGSTTTHYGYNMAGERCWRGSTAGSDTQKISRSCVTGPAGSTTYSHDDDGNNEGLSTSTTPTSYNDRRQVSNIDGLAQDHLDQGNDLRTSTGNIRTINGPLGVTAYQQGNQTVFLSRAPAGQLLTFRPTTGTSLYYISEPNGNIAGATNIAGYLEATYQYAPYGKTSTGGLGHFNPFRYLGEWQETTATGDPGHYKFGARYYDTTGMFTQPDALTGNMGDPRTMTAYNYAGGDPINQADPSGYLTVSLDLGGCLGICVGYRWDYEVGSAGKDDLAVTPYAGVGSPSGPSISFASGGIRSGASRATSCNLGPAGLTSANGGTPQFTAFVGLKALGCSSTASYTFGADQ